MTATVRTDLLLSHAAFTADVTAPFEHVDIEQWLKTLPLNEHKRCAPATTRPPATRSTTTAPRCRSTSR